MPALFAGADCRFMEGPDAVSLGADAWEAVISGDEALEVEEEDEDVAASFVAVASVFWFAGFFAARGSVWLWSPDWPAWAIKFTLPTTSARAASGARDIFLGLHVMEFPPPATALIALYRGCWAPLKLSDNRLLCVAERPCWNAGIMAKNREQVKMEEGQILWPNGQPAAEKEHESNFQQGRCWINPQRPQRQYCEAIRRILPARGEPGPAQTPGLRAPAPETGW
jgi:hypothetical protein